MSEPFKVLSFNTLRQNYDFSKKTWVTQEQREWPRRRELLRQLVMSRGCHIVCAQELENPREDAKFLLDAGFECVTAGKKKQDAHTRPTTFWDTSRFTLEWENRRSRVMITGLRDSLAAPDAPLLYVCNVHLQGGQSESRELQREQQIESALRHLALREDAERIVFAGDFNAERSDACVKMLLKGGYSMCCPQPYSFKWGTCAPEAAFLRIDFILASKALRCVASEDSTDERLHAKDEGLPNSWNPSDHLPLQATLE